VDSKAFLHFQNHLCRVFLIEEWGYKKLRGDRPSFGKMVFQLVKKKTLGAPVCIELILAILTYFTKNAFSSSKRRIFLPRRLLTASYAKP
jgi:hypothetical protein